jgi:succinoglycan biosynthesis transport protein ExoP
MSVEFRQRGINEYLEIAWRRKLAILLPTLAVGLAVGYVVWKLPAMYQSKSLLKITPPAIKAVQQLDADDVSQRLNSITTDVQSRNSLEPLINKFGLYEAERRNGMPMELAVEQMRKNIAFEIVTKTEDQKATNFTVAFKDRDAEKARAVTAELASKYIKSQQDTSIRASKETIEFFDKQLAEIKNRMDEIDRRRLTYMTQNMDKLPSQTQGLIAQLEGLRGQEKTIETEIGRMRDQSAYLAREQNNIREYAEKEAAQQTLLLSDVSRSPAYVELVKRKGDLEAQLKNLLTQYREAHPEVIAKKNEIEQVKKDLVELEQRAKNNSEELRKSTQGSVELRIKNYDNERARIESEISRQQAILEQVRARINDLQLRIESVPSAEVALDAFKREYENEKQNYDNLLKKKNEMDLAANSTLENKGEKIDIVDPASLPQSPVNAAKQNALIAAGFGVGAAIGLLLAFLFEFPRLLTINNLEDARHYTNLPVLAAVPELVTRREARWQRGVSFFKIMTGLAAAAVSVPILIVLLQTTKIFERFTS